MRVAAYPGGVEEEGIARRRLLRRTLVLTVVTEGKGAVPPCGLLSLAGI